MNGDQLKRNILNDMRVELTDEFDKNFERKAFFSDKWKPRAQNYGKGSLLIVTGALRRSIKSAVHGNGVRFTSAVPYATAHNEGNSGTKQVQVHTRKSKKGKQYTVKSHSRKFSLPQRQFIGDSLRTREIIKEVVYDNLVQFSKELSKKFKQ